MNTIKQIQPAPDDSYGVIYKVSLILPVLLMLVLVMVFWWFLRKRK